MFSCKAPAGKRYFQHTKLADIIGAYPVPSGLDDQQALEERQQREVLLDFLLGILDLDPDSRWTPSQALQHPFITQAPFTGTAHSVDIELSLKFYDCAVVKARWLPVWRLLCFLCCVDMPVLADQVA